MRTGLSKTLRKLLTDNPDGLTLKQLSTLSGVKVDAVRSSLRNVETAYIDRWQPAPQGAYAAVYCVVVTPPDCPHPRKNK